jgi:uncharacterized protein (DUF58 family)
MKLWIFLTVLILFVGSIFTDMPGVKIILFAICAFIAVSRIYAFFIIRKLSLIRSSGSGTLFTGLHAENLLTLENPSRLPLHAALISDQSDLRISDKSAHTFISSAEKMSSFKYTYRLTGRRRGKYKVGPSSLRFSDPAGFFTFNVQFMNQHDIIVFPRILRISGARIKSLQPLGSIKSHLPIFEDQFLLSGTREYLPGDEVRKINWKASARRGKHIVNTFQSTVSAESIIFLNLHTDDYRERKRELHVEETIECAASIASMLNETGQKIGLHCNCSIEGIAQLVIKNPEHGDAAFSELLKTLSLVKTAKDLSSHDMFSGSLSISWGCCIYLVTPLIDQTTVAALVPLAQKGHPITIIDTNPGIENSVSLKNIGIMHYHMYNRDGIIILQRV